MKLPSSDSQANSEVVKRRADCSHRDLFVAAGETIATVDAKDKVLNCLAKHESYARATRSLTAQNQGSQQNEGTSTDFLHGSSLLLSNPIPLRSPKRPRHLIV